jgi:dihydroorotase
MLAGAMPDTITIRRPDDWHLHLRDGAMLRAVLPHTARQFARAIVMPNLAPPVTDIAAALAYRERILAALPAGADFTPLMTCYLTDATDPDEVARGFAAGVFTAVKLYPAKATTNSAAGVTDIAKTMNVLERMAAIGMPLLVHGEVTDPDIDIFDREAVFIARILAPLHRRLPELKIVLEHATTSEAVDFVAAAGPSVAATITAHHLVINRNAIFNGGLRPHQYCLPVAKRERHRLALRRAATAGGGKFFLGTDSAPHPLHDKESACGCAGIFTAPAALEIYAQVFDEENALDRLEEFASLAGPRFYGLPVNVATVTLRRAHWRVPELIAAEPGPVVPFLAGEKVAWRMETWRMERGRFRSRAGKRLPDRSATDDSLTDFQDASMDNANSEINDVLREYRKKQRPYAGFWSGFPKLVIEKNVTAEFLSTFEHENGINLGKVREGPNPPDCEIVALNDGIIGVEVTELVDQAMRRESAKASKKGVVWTDYAKWPEEKLMSIIENRIQEKDAAKLKTLYNRYILLIYTDEPMLDDLDLLSKKIGEKEFRATKNITEAWFVGSYRPNIRRYPILRLQIVDR